MSDFAHFFAKVTGYDKVHQWQVELASPQDCGNRLIRIPTGFGKTLGVLATWIWHRVHKRNDDWPRRLIWCLPMRVLVEQTESEVKDALRSLEVLWDERDTHDSKVGVHMLMGGADASQWYLYPECEAVLIGTQDMLLSRAMNRGYASPRARWPMEFGLLNQDALWVMDEVQLMDVGLATSRQLQAFRDDDQGAGKSLRPCFTWWMSATLRSDWLKKSPDTADLIINLEQRSHKVEAKDRVGHLWDDIQKPVEIVKFENVKTLAKEIFRRHGDLGCGKKGPTLVVLNTVERAIEIWKAPQEDPAHRDTNIRLVHSRFRPNERTAWLNDFLNRVACALGMDRIIVSTQVIEAGVDISASLLVTELAPWTSLVQRFGRCARWGGEGHVVVADFQHDNERKAAPYSLGELKSALNACEQLEDVGPLHLENFEEIEEANRDLLSSLYPYEPKHFLLRHEIDELFDTSPDLSGADIDISRFIRSGDERDVQIFWAEVGSIVSPSSNRKPMREELCRVPFLKAREWLCGTGHSEQLKKNLRAWVWNWLERKWRKAKRSDIFPGQTILVDCGSGGYDPGHGWNPEANARVKPIEPVERERFEMRPCWKPDGDEWITGEREVRVTLPEDDADNAEDDESLSVTEEWQTIAAHGWQVGQLARQIAVQVAPQEAELLHLAGRWHDLGKAHLAFQKSIQADGRPERDDIAKAPYKAWPCSPQNMYRIDANDQRRGFRHELASALGLFSVLQRHAPNHQALLGPWRAWLPAMGEADEANGYTARTAFAEPTAIEREILDLGAEEFDMLAYLVCAHHGKVRMAWHASPADQEANDTVLRIRGVRKGDILPPVMLASADGAYRQLPGTVLDLSPSETGLSPRTGRSWTERVLNLVERFGPFTLAWLEALLRAADQRASLQVAMDKLLQNQEDEHVGQSLERDDRSLAPSATGRTDPASCGSNSSTRGGFHGDGGRTGERGVDSGTTRRPYSSTRYIETTSGVLSCQQLAPLLAERVGNVEIRIARGEFRQHSIENLLLCLHQSVCGDLTPNIAGRWRIKNVGVGNHQPPQYWQVPILMREYAADLEIRLKKSFDTSSEELVDVLAHAEGRFLNIHPFEDFNGRVCRLFLIELLYRLNLPRVKPAASSPDETQRYFLALRAFDQHDPRPLVLVWRRRFAQEAPE